MLYVIASQSHMIAKYLCWSPSLIEVDSGFPKTHQIGPEPRSTTTSGPKTHQIGPEPRSIYHIQPKTPPDRA